MDLDWEKLVKRYVWNDERTPYFTRVADLTLRQAHFELFSHALLVGVLSGVLSLAALSGSLQHGDGELVSIYAFTVCCAAVLLGATKHPWAAIWCGGAPLALLAHFAVWGFDPRLDFEDKLLLVLVAIGWLAYSRRLIAVAYAWQRLARSA